MVLSSFAFASVVVPSYPTELKVFPERRENDDSIKRLGRNNTLYCGVLNMQWDVGLVQQNDAALFALSFLGDELSTLLYNLLYLWSPILGLS